MKRLIPLAAGDDLPPKKKGDFLSHLENCPACRAEYEDFTHILESTRVWMDAERPTWKEMEWKKTVRSAASHVQPKSSPLIPWPFRRSWAYTVMAVTAALLFLIITQPRLVDRRGDPTGDAAPLAADSVPGQSVRQMTLVSLESGLQIQWFFNKDFEWKENK